VEEVVAEVPVEVAAPAEVVKRRVVVGTSDESDVSPADMTPRLPNILLPWSWTTAGQRKHT